MLSDGLIANHKQNSLEFETKLSTLGLGRRDGGAEATRKAQDRSLIVAMLVLCETLMLSFRGNRNEIKQHQPKIQKPSLRSRSTYFHVEC